MKLILALVLATIVGCKPQSTAEKTSTTTSATDLGSNSSGALQTGVADTATGTVRGVVRVVGDESPLMPKANQIPVGQCFTGHKMHSKVFRKAADGGVADVLVAVTEYSAKVPLPKTPVEVRMEDCALSARTIVMTPGQEIHAKNVGVIAAIPHLRGAPQAALVVAVPGGDPIILTPINAGRYLLEDASHEYATADVFVLNFPTAGVTDELGKFEISGIPAGNVKLNALLPDAGLTVEQRVDIEPNKTTDVVLELHFDRGKWQATVDEAKSKLGNEQAH